MVVTVAIVVATNNLAIGVIVGVLLSAVFFARRIAHMVQVTSVLDPDGDTCVYAVTGSLFFASSTDLAHHFDFTGPTSTVVIDLTDAHIWDTSAIAALDGITAKYTERGSTVELVGLNEHSHALHSRLSGRLAPSH
jgi:SulP family sulfate permease